MKVTLKRDGLTLVGDRLDVHSSEYDMVIFFHGFGTNKDNEPFKRWAKDLQKVGIASVRFDFNGSGESDGEFRHMTIWNEVEDANAILNYVRKDPHVRRIYLIGHSQGGVVASILAGLYPDIIAGVILLSAASVLKEDAKHGRLLGYSYDPKNIPEEFNVYGLTVGGFYLQIAKNLPIYEIAKNFTGPVLIIDGDRDFVVPVKYAQQYDQIYQNSRLKIVPGLGHDYLGYSTTRVSNLINEFLREIN